MGRISRFLSLAIFGASLLWIIALFHGFSSNSIFCFDTVRNEGCGSSVGWSGSTVLWLAPLVVILSLWARIALAKTSLRRQNQIGNRLLCPSCEGDGYTFEADPEDPSELNQLKVECHCDNGFIYLEN